MRSPISLSLRYATDLDPNVGYLTANHSNKVHAMPVIMKLVLGLSGIAPTRTIVGLLAQRLAGDAGGYLFCRLSAPAEAC